MHPDRKMPDVLRSLNRMDFDYADGEGIDFKPYDEFLSAAETRNWLRAWTGNQALSGDDFLVFGQDGTGGMAAFWRVVPDVDILNQPVVFLGSEGELGVVAKDFWDYLWLLAGRFGPCEAVMYPSEARIREPLFDAFAHEHAETRKATPAEVLERARSAFPQFVTEMQGLIR